MAHLFNKGIYYIENGTDPNVIGLAPTDAAGLAKTEDGSSTWRYDDALPTNKWVLDNLDKFHTNILATSPYDPLNPLTGWVAPSSPIAGNTVEVKFTDGTVGNYTFDGTDWVLDFADSTATAKRPWIKIGNTTETSATDVLKTDQIYHIGNTRFADAQTPLAPIHVGDSQNNPSTLAQILIAKNVNTVGIAGHAFSDGSNINNGQSYNSFDARAYVNSNINSDASSHIAQFQSGLTVNPGFTLKNLLGYVEGYLNSGTIESQKSLNTSIANGVVNDYTALDINNTGKIATNSAIGVNAINLKGSNESIGINTINLGEPTTAISTGLNISNVQGVKARPIKIFTNQANTPIDYYYNLAGSFDFILIDRPAGVMAADDGEFIKFKASQGATDYFQGKIGMAIDNDFKGRFEVYTNPTGGTGIGAISKTFTVDSDGSVRHNGYQQYLTAFPTSGAGVPNGSQFKGTDGALYYKGGSGTVTLIAPN